MIGRKKYYLLASDLFDALYKIYGTGNIEFQKIPNDSSRKVAEIKIGTQNLFLSVQHIRSCATCFISSVKPKEFDHAKHEIISLYAGMYAQNKLRAIWWIEAGDEHMGISKITTLINWGISISIEKINLYIIFYGMISDLLKNENELYERTNLIIPDQMLPSLLPELVEE